MQKIRAFKCSHCLSALVCLVFLVSSGLGQTMSRAELEVEPGLTIPNSKTPWAVDEFGNHRQIVPIHHSMVTVNKHAGANVAGSLAGSVFYKPKLTTELDGLSSRNQLHFDKPVFYLLFDEDQDPDGQGKSSDRYDFVISRVEAMKDKRVVDQLAYTQLTGNAKRTDSVVETETTFMSDGWMRIVPKAPMPEGEYVLLPIPKLKGSFSQTVWDFGIHAQAPNAKDAIRATSQTKGN
jgi:hypothetical protein